MRIQQPHDSSKKARKRARRYRAERSIVCKVFIFIEAITGPFNSIVGRDEKKKKKKKLQKIIVERFPSDGVFCVFVVFWCFFLVQGPHKCANTQIAVPA
jgi:hypothetical protein